MYARNSKDPSILPWGTPKLSCSCTATTKAILVKLVKMVIEFECFATPWKFDAKFPIFVRFPIFVNFTTL